MTNPQDPYGTDPFSYDPLGRPPLPPPPVYTPPPPPPPPPPVNAFATLSLVFAFVFAPAGAILGHLGLAQIRRTGELGRDRALVGMVLSYAIIASTVAAVAAWAVFAAVSPARGPTATPTPTAGGPPPRTVAPAALPALLPNLDALKTITADQNLEAGPTRDHPSRTGQDGAVDPPECWGSVAAGVPDAYPVDAIVGYHAAKFSDTRTLLKSVEVLESVVAFRDAPAAQTQLAKLLSGWRQCAGSNVRVTIPEVGPIPYSLSGTSDDGNGISTMVLIPQGLQVRSARAVAAKANVVIDLSVTCRGTTDGDRPRQSAVSIANYVLDKVPG